MIFLKGFKDIGRSPLPGPQDLPPCLLDFGLSLYLYRSCIRTIQYKYSKVIVSPTG